jgi:hypothetical protein
MHTTTALRPQNLLLDAHKRYTRKLKIFTWSTQQTYMSTTMSTSDCISYAVLRDYSLPGHTSSTSTSLRTASTRLPVAAALRQPCRALRVLVSRLQRLYINHAARPGASARHAARRAARRRLLRLAQACRQLLRLCHASGCLGTSRGSSRSS